MCWVRVLGLHERLLFGMAALALTVTAWSPTADAVTVRSDKAPLPGGIGAYWDSGNTFSNVANLGSDPGNTGTVNNSCTGTLLNSRTILTATHCFSIDHAGGFTYDFNLLGNFRITFSPDSQDATPYRVTGVLGHAGYDGEAANDVALLTLDRPVLDIVPVVLTNAAPNVGDVILVSGYGLSGAAGRDVVVDNGNGPEFQNSDDRRRIAYNYVDHAGIVTGETNLIVFDVDDPNNPLPFGAGIPGITVSNTPVHTFEGSSAGGDSGGPMFLQLGDSSWVQVGISQGGGDPNNTGDANYSSFGTYTNVAAYLDWIAQNNPLREVSASGTGNWGSATLWSENRVPSNVASMTPGEARYFNVTLSQPGLVSVEADYEVDRLTLSGGALTVTTANSLTLIDKMIVGAGSIVRVDGSVVGTTQVASGGVLGGSGSVVGALNNAGVLSPGNSIGQLAVDGTLALQAGGQMLIEVDVTGADRVDVTGAAALGGGVQFAPDIRLPTGQTFTFLSANTLSGAFGSVGSISLFYVPTLTQTGTEVRVTLTKTGSVADIAPDGGSRNVARVLENLPQGVAEGLRNAIAALGSAQTVGEARAILRQLSGENHGLDPSLGQGAIAGVNTLLANRLARIGGATSGPGVTLAALTQEQAETLNGAQGAQTRLGRRLHRGNRLSSLFATLAPVGVSRISHIRNEKQAPTSSLAVGSARSDLATGIWLETFRTYGDVEASTQASGVGYRILGTTIGFDGDVSERLVLGGAVSYTKTDTDIVTGLGDGAETRATHATVYGRYGLEGFDFLGAFSLTKNETEAMRITRIGGATQQAASAYDGWAMSANAGVTTKVSFQGFDIMPGLSLAYVHQSTDGFSETGSGALLTVSSRRNDALNLSGIVRFARAFELTSQISVTPEVRVGGIYDLLNEDASVVARFTGTASSFRTQGAQTDRGGAVLGGGAVFHLQDGLHLYADYDGYFAGNETSHTGLVGARLSF